MSNSEPNKSLFFSVKVGKSSNNRGWSLIRDQAIYLYPKLSYEEECDIIVDGIQSKARLNVSPRIFFKNKKLTNHLEVLSKKGVKRVDLELLLNHESLTEEVDVNELLTKINNLNHELFNKDLEINKLKEDINHFQSFESNDKDKELEKLNEEIANLKKVIDIQNNKMDNLFNQVIQLEIDNEESSKKRIYYEEENKKLRKKLTELLEVLQND